MSANEAKEELRNRFAGLVAATPTPTAVTPPPTETPEPVQTDIPHVEPMPIAQKGTDTARPYVLKVPLSDDEDKTLKRLRSEDRITAAARIRAMLHVYLIDERYRKKVDKTAKDVR